MSPSRASHAVLRGLHAINTVSSTSSKCSPGIRCSYPVCRPGTSSLRVRFANAASFSIYSMPQVGLRSFIHLEFPFHFRTALSGSYVLFCDVIPDRNHNDGLVVPWIVRTAPHRISWHRTTALHQATCTSFLTACTDLLCVPWTPLSQFSTA